MRTCKHTRCPSNHEGRCTASGEISLDEEGRCLVARQLLFDEIAEILEFLHRFRSYPLNERKDREFLYELLHDFPEVDIREQFKSFHAWVLDLKEEKKINYRSSIRRWIRRAHDKLLKFKKSENETEEEMNEEESPGENNAFEKAEIGDQNPL